MSEKTYRFKDHVGSRFYLTATDEEHLKRRAKKIFNVDDLTEITELTFGRKKNTAYNRTPLKG